MPEATILQFLEGHPKSHIALAVHMRPDGDAIGSAIGLAEMLRLAGHTATLVNPRPIPTNLTFLLEGETVLFSDDANWWNDFDCLGALDCGEIGRLDEVNRGAAAALPAFNIDHHVTSGGIGQAVWIDPKASATGEMIVRLCQEAGWKLTPRAAQALWTAIVTDTGRFSFENTSPEALIAARECLLAGASPALTTQKIYQSVSVPERKLQTVVLERMELLHEGRLGLSWLRWQDFLDAGIGVEGAQDQINLVRDTEGVEVAIFLYEPAPDKPGATPSVKISMRTQSPHSALDLVTLYGGGGHMRAAGGSLAAPLEEVRERVLKTATEKYFTSP